MKTLVKKTKTKTYIKFNDELFLTNNNWNNRELEKLDLSTLDENQKDAINTDSGWVSLPASKDENDAYDMFINYLVAEAKERKQKDELYWKEVEKERTNAWNAIKSLETIPSTIENVKLVLQHLNSQNWGSWSLPKMSIGYSANQFDCEGKIASTMKLDKGISNEFITNEKMFKIGGKRGHLNKYQSL